MTFRRHLDQLRSALGPTAGGLARQITDRAIETSRRWLRRQDELPVHALPYPACLIQGDRVVAASPAALRFLGVTDLGELRRHGLEVFKTIEDQPWLGRALGLIDRQEQPGDSQVTAWDIDGERRYVELTVSPLCEHALVTWQDLTGYLASEARIITLLDTMPWAVCVFHRARVAYANDEAARMFRAERREELIGKSPVMVFAEEQREVLTRNLEGRLAGDDRVPNHYEAKLQRMDGEVFPAVIHGSLTSFEGEPATQYVLQDISKSKQREDALGRRLGLEEALRRSAGRFLGAAPDRFDESVQMMLEELGWCVDADCALVFDLNDRWRNARLRYRWIRSGRSSWAERLTIAGTTRLGESGSTFEREGIVEFWDRQSIPREIIDRYEEATDGPVGSILILRMRDGGAIEGALTLSWEQPGRRLPREEINLLALAADSLAAALARAQLDEALRRSERQFRSVIESIPIGLYFFRLEEDERLVIDLANGAADEILGDDHRRLAGLSFEQAFPAIASTAMPRRFRQVLDDGHPLHDELSGVLTEDPEQVFEIFAFRSNPGSLGLAFIDVTERKRWHARLARQSQDLKILSRSAMEFVQLESRDDLFARIAARFVELITEAALVMVYEYDEVEGRVRLRSRLEITERAAILEPLLPSIPPSSPADQWSQAAYEAMVGGELTILGAVDELLEEPAPQSEAVGDELGDLYAMGFVQTGLFYGGVVFVMQKDEAPLTEAVRAFAGQVVVVLERRRGERELALRNQELTALLSLASTGGRLTDLDEMLDVVLRRVVTLSGHSAVVWLASSADLDRPAFMRRFQMVAGRRIDGTIELPEHGPASLSSLLPNPAEPEQIQESSSHEGRPSGLSLLPDCREASSTKLVPLRAGGLVLGYLCLFLQDRSHSSFERPRFLRALGHQVGLGLRNAQLYRSLREQEGRLRLLAAQLSHTEEEQRRKIAHNIHDFIGQPLAMAAMLLSAADSGESGLDELAREQRERIEHLLNEASQHTRGICFDLFPPILESFGLAATLEKTVADFQETTGVPVELELWYREMAESTEIRSFLYRAAKELLVNAVKHAKPQQLRLELVRREAMLRLVVIDDGVGFDTDEVLGLDRPPRGLGLFSMSERAASMGGAFRVESSPNGTRVVLELPI